MSDDNFLSRWSRRKHQARQGAELDEVPQMPPPAANPPAARGEAALSTEPAEDVAPPPVESLTPESDFTPFMKPNVDGDLRNQAMKKLFEDPRFNVMDGLDVYIDDYSKPDPLPEGGLEKMSQVARLGDYQPPQEAEEAPAPSEGEAEVAALEETAEKPEPAADAEPSEAASNERE